MKLIRMFALAAPLAAAGLAVPALGQDGAGAEKRAGETQQAEGQKRGAEAKQGEAGAQRGNAEKQAGQGGARAKEQGKENAGDKANAGADKPAVDTNRKLNREEAVDLLRRLQQEENLHRKHMARLERLAQLSREAKDESRGKEVADLLAQENARHQRAMAQIEKHVGSENFRKGQQKLRDAVRDERAGQQAGGKGNAKGKEKEGDTQKENAERKDGAGTRGGGDGEQKGGGR